MIKTNATYDRFFYIFVIFHVLIWTLLPSLVRLNLPLDAMEGTTWGHQLEWGYDKNPFMNAWLTAFAIHIGNYSDTYIYLFSQLCVALAFCSIWMLCKKIVSPLYAIMSVLFLELIQYYNFHAIDFNDNTLEVGFWALSIYFFFNVYKKPSYINWIKLGIVAALTMMIKYYSALLFLSMALLLWYNASWKIRFNHYPFYAGAIVFLVFCSPHIVWLFSHDFLTVHYALNRVDSVPSWSNHFFYPLQFSLQQFETILPTLLLALFIYFIPSQRANTPLNLSVSDKRFIYFIGLGPFLLTILISFLFGFKLRAGWGQPLFSLWGLMLIIALKPQWDIKRFYLFFSVICLTTIILAVAYGFALIRASETSSANFPGKFISNQLTSEWHHRFSTPLKYVGGPRWIAGNISYYTKEHPAVFIDWNKQLSPWISESDLLNSGALFVWDLSERVQIPYSIVKKQYPSLSSLKTIKYTWLRNKNLPPIILKVAFLPPSQ